MLCMHDVTLKQFGALVESGIAALPKEFLEKIRNVAMVIQDEPTEEQLKENGVEPGHTLLGLYEGIPQIDRWGYGEVTPDKITIFKHPILEEAEFEADIARIVTETVWHEIAHHFGMEDDAIEAAEHRRNQT